MASIGRTQRIILVTLALLIVFSASYSFRRSTDAHLNSLQTRSLVLHGDTRVDRYGQDAGITFERNGARYSIYGAGVSVLAAPMYAVLVRAGASERILHAAASIPFGIAAIVLMLVLLNRIASASAAWFATGAFAFGTTMWPTAMNAFWQHAPVSLLQVIGLWGLTSERRARGEIVAGAALATAAWVRTPSAATGVLIASYVATRGPRAIARFSLGALPAVIAIAIENYVSAGTVFSAGRRIDTDVGFGGDLIGGLAGGLFGWWRGIFVYSPVLILAVVGAVLVLRRWRDPRAWTRVGLTIATAGALLVYATFEEWWGGTGQFGYRLHLDILPFLIPLVAVAWDRLRRMRPAMVGLLVASVAIMAMGAAPDREGWDTTAFPSFSESPIGRAAAAFLDDPWPASWRIAAALAAIAALRALPIGRATPDRRVGPDLGPGARAAG